MIVSAIFGEAKELMRCTRVPGDEQAAGIEGLETRMLPYVSSDDGIVNSFKMEAQSRAWPLGNLQTPFVLRAIRSEGSDLPVAVDQQHF